MPSPAPLLARCVVRQGGIHDTVVAHRPESGRTCCQHHSREQRPPHDVSEAIDGAGNFDEPAASQPQSSPQRRPRPMTAPMGWGSTAAGPLPGPKGGCILAWVWVTASVPGSRPGEMGVRRYVGHVG